MKTVQESLKTGLKVIAVNECLIDNGVGATLTVDKSYTVIKEDLLGYSIVDDIGRVHKFEEWDKYFKLPSTLDLHPLLTKGKNKHYDKAGKSTIEQLEEQISVERMIGFCQGNIFKYRSREKGSNEADEAKAIAYERYLDFLATVPPLDRVMSVRAYMKSNNIEFSYGM